MTREDILNEIRRTAKENGGKPLGKKRFELVTGIRPYDWGKYWARIGDAHREAGLEANKLTSAYSDEFLMEQIISLIRDLKKFPTSPEMRIRHLENPRFPDSEVFRRFGNKNSLVAKVYEYSQGKPEYRDIVKLLEPILPNNRVGEAMVSVLDNKNIRYGFVYLVKGHPGEYKIGRTNLVDRRLSELGATASIEQQLIHEIRTDDPAGVEIYWHTRFAEKRMKGEWFSLNPADVQAFRRWRNIY